MPRICRLALLFACLAGALAAAPAQDDYGVLVMAHGGSPEWDATVEAAVEPLRAELNVEIAFGMADADRMQAAIAELERRGARRIGVVRVFIDGDSFLERTEKILGLRPGAPPVEERQESRIPGMQMATYRLQSASAFALQREGLNEAPETDRILLARARALSREPGREMLMLISHGAGTAAENESQRAQMHARTRLLAAELDFARIVFHALAEDWPELRGASEAAIRADIAAAHDEGLTPIVVPFRLSGFGPYAEVLEGLDYRADGTALLPHPALTDWIRRHAEELRARPFVRPGESTEPDGDS